MKANQVIANPGQTETTGAANESDFTRSVLTKIGKAAVVIASTSVLHNKNGLLKTVTQGRIVDEHIRRTTTENIFVTR